MTHSPTTDSGATLTSLESSVYLYLHKPEFSTVKDFVSKGFKKRSVKRPVSSLSVF